MKNLNMIKQIKQIEEQFKTGHTSMLSLFSDFIKKYLEFEDKVNTKISELDNRELKIKKIEDINKKEAQENQEFKFKLIQKEKNLKQFESELNNNKERLDTRAAMINALEAQNATKQQSLEQKEFSLKERSDGISIREAELIVKERKLEEAKKLLNFQSI